MTIQFILSLIIIKLNNKHENILLLFYIFNNLFYVFIVFHSGKIAPQSPFLVYIPVLTA